VSQRLESTRARGCENMRVQGGGDTERKQGSDSGMKEQ
jgi:hypothetical protein